MLSGRDTLKALNRALTEVRTSASVFDADLARERSRVDGLRLRENRLLRSLAALRLDDLEAQALSGDLTRAENGALQLLEDRELAEERSRAQAHSHRAELETLEAQRESLHETVDTAAAALAECEAAVQQALDADEGYRAQLALAREAEGIAEHAERKTEQAEEDRKVKGEPYEKDPLFSYLSGRGYGTPEYRAGFLARWLDGWVARVCRYESARPAYFMLGEIPRRLREHATAVRYQAEAQVQKLSEWETRAADAAGVPAAQAALADAEAAQDRCDDEIDATEVALHAIEESIGRFAAGNDDYTRRALELLAAAYSKQETERLTTMAWSTPGDEDDALVRALSDLREERHDALEELEEQRRARDRHAEKLSEIEDLRRRFKRNRYDDLRSGFRDGKIVQAVIAEFLRGAISGGRVWDTLRRQQRYQDVGGAWPDFGSGGFKRGGRRGPWHWPGTSGRGGFRLPRSGGSRSRGGFRTGGGF
ncbi:MAG: hypothetical protein AAGI15_11900 [Pseudomonadota bacterium]